MQTYVLATGKEWHLREFEARRDRLPGQWAVVISPQDLAAIVNALKPRFIFFPHWSHIVPMEILQASECVCFHMTDVPYGRGGSPLQNLIERGHAETRLTALRMEQGLDTGPVYMKRPLSLTGSAREIFQRTARQVLDMMELIVREEPTPVPQQGPATEFKRRKPEQSLVPPNSDLTALYDHIRMLDADDYPHAFVDHGHWRIHFTNANPEGETLKARAHFVRKKDQ